jgi:hypothetical protein
MFVEGCGGFEVTGCHIEGFTNGGTGSVVGIAVNCLGGSIAGNVFVDNSSTTGGTGVYVGYTSRGITIGPNNFLNTDKMVEIADDAHVRSCIVYPQQLPEFTSGSVASRVVVPEAADRGHIILPATKTGFFGLTAGIEFPRLTAARRDSLASPASGGTRREGLVLYNDTSNRLNFWDGAKWIEAGGVATQSGSEKDYSARTTIISPAVTLLSSPPAGFYRVSVYGLAHATMTGPQTITLHWTDERSVTQNLGLTLGKTAGNLLQEVRTIYIPSGNLTFDTSGTIGSGSFDLHIRVEAQN